MRRILLNIRFTVLCGVLGSSCTISAQAPDAPRDAPQDYTKLTYDLSLYISQKLAENKVNGASVAIVDGRGRLRVV
jgi:hypothetical protein